MIISLNSPNSLSSNVFTGRLPLQMGSMESLRFLFVNVQTLSGPLPEFYKLRDLQICDVSSADYCRDWVAPPKTEGCDFEIVPVCNTDCLILYEWIGSSPGRCCSSAGIKCDTNGRIEKM
jgi:hypothetical protein